MDATQGEDIHLAHAPFLPDGKQHQCKQNPERFPYWTAFRPWWILPVHLIFVFAAAVIALVVIQGKLFAIDGDRRYPSELTQVDIQTLVSAWLTVLRLVVSAWFSLLGWRIAFMTLERTPITLSHVSRIVQFGIPEFPSFTALLSGKRRTVCYEKPSQRFHLLAWLAFIFAIPSQLVSPLASGAFKWSPVFRPAAPESGQHDTATITRATAGFLYQYFNSYDEHRIWVRQKASALSALLATPGDYTADAYPSRAVWPTLQGKPLHMFVENATLPVFQIHSLTWNNRTVAEGLDVLDHALNDPNGTLYLSGNGSPFSGTFVGAAVLLLDEPWQATTTYSQLPSPELISETLWIAVRFSRSNVDNIYIPNCEASSYVFGDVPDGVTPLTTYYDGRVDNCYAVGRVSFTAGALTSNSCEIVQENVIQYNVTAKDLSPIADSMTYNALHLMPEVMSDITLMNITTLDTWNDLEGFVRKTLSVAYQASWNALQTHLSEGNSGSAQLWEPRSMLRADVSVQKIIAWLMLHVLMTLSGVVLMIPQRQSRARPVENPVLTAIMLDSREVIDQDSSGLCTARVECDQHRQTWVALKWREDNSTRRHPMLVVDRRRPYRR